MSWNRISILLLLLCAATLAQGQSRRGRYRGGQKADFRQIEILPNHARKGVRGILFRFDLEFAYRAMEITGTDESLLRYGLTVHLYDAEGAPLPALQDAGKYRDSQGFCRDTSNATLAAEEREIRERELFIPYHAMGLPAGPQSIEARLEVHAIPSGSFIGASEMLDLNFENPEKRLVRFAMSRLDVAQDNSEEGPWDFALFNPKEVAPDMFWSLQRGSEIIFNGRRHNNTFSLILEEEEKSSFFTLSEGDEISLQVHDYDMIGFSDMIGEQRIAPWAEDFPNGKIQEHGFDHVLRTEYRVSELPFPDLRMRRFRVEEDQKYEGVSGVMLQFEYSLAGLVAEESFPIELSCLTGDKAFEPEYVEVVSGPATQEGGRIELVGGRGEVRLFIPHYGYAGQLSGQGEQLLMRLNASLEVEGKDFQLLTRQRELSRPDRPVSDLLFGQWRLTEEVREGLAGILIESGYDTPRPYHRDLGSKQVAIQLQVRTEPRGEVWTMSPGGWQGDTLFLRERNAKGKLELFVPYAFLPADVETAKLKLVCQAWAFPNGRAVRIGRMVSEPEFSVPQRRQASLFVREIRGFRDRNLYPVPRLRWRVVVGRKEVFRSVPGGSDYLAKWKTGRAAQFVLMEDDEFKLIFEQVFPNGTVKRMGAWKGKAAELPFREGKLAKLRIKGIRVAKLEALWSK